MRHVLVLAAAALALAGCGDEVDPDEHTMADERDIAMVERANETKPPLRIVTPEPILLPDIERYDLLGETCSYAPGTSLGARVIAREADAFMKIEGKIERFAADPGARELPTHTRSVYNSKDYSVVLALREASAEPGEEPAQPPGGEGGSYEGSVTLRDAHGRIVYQGTGLAQCAD
jgi:hypothetical protein